MTLSREHLRFAAINRVQGDEAQRMRHLRLAEEAQEACDSGRCRCSVKCEPYSAAFNGWTDPFGDKRSNPPTNGIRFYGAPQGDGGLPPDTYVAECGQCGDSSGLRKTPAKPILWANTHQCLTVSGAA